MAAHPTEHWVGVRVDVQGIKSASAACARLENALELARLGSGAATKGAKRVRKVGAVGVNLELDARGAADPWARMGDLIAEAAKKARGKRRLFVAFDEAPWWLDSIRKEGGAPAARAALAQLRHLRQRDDLCERVRWILTGSVGLGSLARQLDAAAEIGDLQPPYELRPLDAAAGEALFESELVQSGRTATRTRRRTAQPVGFRTGSRSSPAVSRARTRKRCKLTERRSTPRWKTSFESRTCLAMRAARICCVATGGSANRCWPRC